MLNKEVQIKVYSKTGAFITTLQDTLISTSVSFDLQINSGVGRLSFNYHDDYAFNITDVIQVNDGQGRVIYRGWISNKKTSITSTGNVQTIEAQGMQTLLNSLYFPDGVVTDDPKNILEDILDVYNATAIFRREYDFTTYGSNISVEFTNDTLLSAINKVLENQSFYLYFGMDGVATYTPTVIKDRVGTNDGTPTGLVTIDDGGINFAGDRNHSTGSGSMADVNMTNLTLPRTEDSDFEILTTVKIDGPSLSVNSGIFGLRFKLGRQINTSGHINFGMREGGTYWSYGYLKTNYNYGDTLHLRIKYIGANKRFYPYVNNVLIFPAGILITTFSISNNPFGMGDNFILNVNPSSSPKTVYQGLLYERNLTDEEATQIYNAGRYSPSPVRTGLIAEYYHSNIAGKVEYKPYYTNLPTTIYDYAGSNNGTTSGGLTVDDGAMVFNTSQNVAFNTGIGVQSLSVVCKFKLGADGINSATSLMVSILNNVYLHVRGSVNTIVFRYDNTSIARSASFTLGTGNRNRVDAVGVLIDNGGTWTIQLYVNGVLAQSNTYSEVPNITYGYVKGLGGNTFVGEIAYNGIYNRALNATEITQIYNAGRNARSPIRDGLIAEYHIPAPIKTNLGNEVNAIDIDYNGQQLQNDLTIEYDGGTTTVADSTSISLHGTYKKYIKDTSIKNLATATERGNAILAKNAYPKEQTKVILNREYDIESIKPGQTISVLNTNESVKNKTIQRIRYSIQGVELEVDEFDTIEKSVKKSLSS